MDNSVVNLSQHLTTLGVFTASQVVIVGEEHFSEQATTLCTRQGLEVFRFGKDTMGESGDKHTHYFPLNTHSLKRQIEVIQRSKDILVFECNAKILETLLISVVPFCRIMILGAVKPPLRNLNFYSTVHYKNLELLFCPVRC